MYVTLTEYIENPGPTRVVGQQGTNGHRDDGADITAAESERR